MLVVLAQCFIPIRHFRHVISEQGIVIQTEKIRDNENAVESERCVNATQWASRVFECLRTHVTSVIYNINISCFVGIGLYSSNILLHKPLAKVMGEGKL